MAEKQPTRIRHFVSSELFSSADRHNSQSGVGRRGWHAAQAVPPRSFKNNRQSYLTRHSLARPCRNWCQFREMDYTRRTFPVRTLTILQWPKRTNQKVGQYAQTIVFNEQLKHLCASHVSWEPTFQRIKREQKKFVMNFSTNQIPKWNSCVAYQTSLLHEGPRRESQDLVQWGVHCCFLPFSSRPCPRHQSAVSLA